jgi:hypothetical protein
MVEGQVGFGPWGFKSPADTHSELRYRAPRSGWQLGSSPAMRRHANILPTGAPQTLRRVAASSFWATSSTLGASTPKLLNHLVGIEPASEPS